MSDDTFNAIAILFAEQLGLATLTEIERLKARDLLECNVRDARRAAADALVEHARAAMATALDPTRAAKRLIEEDERRRDIQNAIGRHPVEGETAKRANESAAFLVSSIKSLLEQPEVGAADTDSVRQRALQPILSAQDA